MEHYSLDELLPYIELDEPAPLLYELHITVAIASKR